MGSRVRLRAFFKNCITQNRGTNRVVNLLRSSESDQESLHNVEERDANLISSWCHRPIDCRV